ncbi:MAG: hypothetical protein ACI9IT_000511 [Glaciecola sp.]|jgi:hypothetical protein
MSRLKRRSNLHHHVEIISKSVLKIDTQKRTRYVP